MKERIIIVAGPRRGKSTLASRLSKNCHPHAGTTLLVERHPPAPIYCGDPLSKVKEPMAGVTYLPEGIPFSGDDGAAAWVADNWFTMPGPWICEGHVMARALRRWLGSQYGGPLKGYPADRIIVLDRPGFGSPSNRQNGMHAGVMKVWYGDLEKDEPGICHWFEPITEYQ